jgi:hypothetical protein
LVGWTSRTLLELAIGIARGFIASGISRTRSMCRRPFSRLAPFDLYIVGELEVTFEVPRGDALVEHVVLSPSISISSVNHTSVGHEFSIPALRSLATRR